MDLTTIINLLQQELGPGVHIEADIKTIPPAMLVPAKHVAEVCRILHEHPQLYFDYLACITALDNGPSKGTLEVIYNLYTIPYHFQLMVKVLVATNKIDEPLPTIPTVSHIWQAANWHEREAYDLVGICFTGHPDLRRILLPADWEGHPLRVDYVYPKLYHGISVD